MKDRAEVIGLCIDRGGFRRGARVAQFITEWEIAVRSHRGPIGIEEFGAWWKESTTRTAYRRLAEYRQMFPELGPHGTPNDLLRPLLERLTAGDQPDDIPTGVLALP